MKRSLLQSLFDEEERRPLSITELTGQIKGALESRFKNVWLEGEITNFAAASSGHWYFTLRDDFSQLKSACYRGANYRIRFQPFDGLQVRVSGKLTVYEPKGEYQILVESLEPVGEGAMKIAFEQLKTKLEREGLFSAELKRPLPFFPRRVAVVTSPNGAAIHDILHVIARRTRTVDVLLIPTRVQGESAPQEIRDAIELANEQQFRALQTGDKANQIDVLIVGRGGGSMEDLWAFNDERVARAIRNSLIPVISAVGHETDFTIADFVADFRAPTPSAAAEIVAAQESQIAAFLEERIEDMRQAIEYKLLEARSDLQELRGAAVFTEFPARIRETRQKIETDLHRIESSFARRTQILQRRFDAARAKLSPAILKTQTVKADSDLRVLRQKLDSVIKTKIDGAGEKLGITAASLGALSPLAVLGRGFSVVQKSNGEIVRDAKTIENGEDLRVRLGNGSFDCRVTQKIENGNQKPE
ncbi:MAG TPA: exodeoxyribonuclease VII large subunit [Pyrinomonadaceae bacterium]|nr:exodeoxyribonuclease VII large subunit [Pyrinomonadaceae bacterium]